MRSVSPVDVCRSGSFFTDFDHDMLIPPVTTSISNNIRLLSGHQSTLVDNRRFDQDSRNFNFSFRKFILRKFCILNRDVPLLQSCQLFVPQPNVLESLKHGCVERMVSVPLTSITLVGNCLICPFINKHDDVSPGIKDCQTHKRLF